ncbi:ABC transporter permease [Pelagibius sp. 7325]|uniref:ABC transporter permease n=1 Tax=Pelagibius sp. 7325 TaxID=3131994 RepID=UPI0030EE828A
MTVALERLKREGGRFRKVAFKIPTFGLWRFPGVVGCAAGWLALMMIFAVFADVIAPFSYEQQNLLGRLQPPFWLGGSGGYILGADELGRDVFSRTLFAIRTSMAVALLGTLIGALLGTFLGFLAARFRGWVEDLVMMLVDWQAAMPFLIIALAVLAFMGNNLVLFIALMGIYGWEKYARVARGLVLSAQEQGYALAVRSLGAGGFRLYFRHILPNVLSPLIVLLTLNIPDTILMETTLSFLGFGIQPPRTSLGLMLGLGRDYLLTAWWIAVVPGVVIFLTTLSISLVGDWLRDRFDPTLQ